MEVHFLLGVNVLVREAESLAHRFFAEHGRHAGALRQRSRIEILSDDATMRDGSAPPC